ncbi:hypothetical protein B484DRAFT_414253 [Ochromonadaceae sp. CCMP2298]|nr:hypothetical protein B484DRAFT_414253 [Ochromonadaceae sp. CCMP2298]
MHAASYHQPQRPQGPWDAELDQWWAEVGLLLRKPILEEEDMLYTVAAAEAGLMYTDQMNEIATMLQVLRGALSRWILPYDNNTRIESQCSTPHSVVENMPQEFRGRLTERQVHYLVAGANGVRRLIRVKIADDNDLEQARKALKSLDMFFKALYHRAGEAQMLPYALLQMAESYVP